MASAFSGVSVRLPRTEVTMNDEAPLRGSMTVPVPGRSDV
jgi:hypothetical protein